MLVAAYGDEAHDLYAIDAFRGLIASDDGGRTWGEGSALPGVPVYAMGASLDGASVLVGTGEGAFLSNDAGSSWERILEMPTAAVAIDAGAAVAFLVTREGEVYRYQND